MNRGPVGLTVFTFIIGSFAIYLGLGIMNVGGNVSDIGGAFGTELAALGGLWTALGAVLVLLGILSFPMGLGIAALKEWGRKNGVYVVFFIAGVCVVAGFMVAYFDLMASIIYFVLTVLALICGQMLREKKTLFEFGGGTRRSSEPASTYREVRQAQEKVLIRQSDAARVQHKSMVKCTRCGTVNEADKSHCKMCANKLTGVY